MVEALPVVHAGSGRQRRTKFGNQSLGEPMMNRVYGFILQGSFGGPVDDPEGNALFPSRNGISGKHIEQIQILDQGFAEADHRIHQAAGFDILIHNNGDIPGCRGKTGNRCHLFGIGDPLAQQLQIQFKNKRTRCFRL